MRKRTIAAAVGLLLIAGLFVAVSTSGIDPGRPDIPDMSVPGQPGVAQDQTAHPVSGTGAKAMDQAARANQYLFAFFWQTETPETTTMKKVFEEAVEKVADRARSVQVCITDASEQDMVKKFDLDRAPMPLVLAFAPNGAIMGGFPQKFTEADLLGAFGTPCMERCMKSLQGGKLVLLCVQNKATASNAAAIKGVREFAADPRYAGATTTVMLDPGDAAEKAFLADLKIDPNTAEAITAFMAPPGAVIAEFKGATDKDALIAALNKANTGCGPGGCGPGGCGPKP